MISSLPAIHSNKATIGDKIRWDTSPQRGFLTFYRLQKGEIKLSLPLPSIHHPFHSMLCRWATYRKQQTPQLWMEGRGKSCGIFCSLKLPCLSTMSQHFWADCRFDNRPLIQILQLLQIFHILCFISLTFYSSPRSYQQCRYIFSTPLEEGMFFGTRYNGL